MSGRTVPLGGVPAAGQLPGAIGQSSFPLSLTGGASYPKWQTLLAATYGLLIYRVRIAWADASSLVSPAGDGRYTISAIDGHGDVVDELLDEWAALVARAYRPAEWEGYAGRGYYLAPGQRLAFAFGGVDIAGSNYRVSAQITHNAG